MKKAILAIAMLFNVAIYGVNNDIEGIWHDSSDIGYYIIIMEDKQKEYKVTSFSFRENHIVKETIVESGENYVITKFVNPDNNWTVECNYKFLHEGFLEVTYSGDYNGTYILNKKEIN